MPNVTKRLKKKMPNVTKRLWTKCRKLRLKPKIASFQHLDHYNMVTKYVYGIGIGDKLSHSFPRALLSEEHYGVKLILLWLRLSSKAICCLIR